MLTDTAIVAADEIMIPVQTEYSASADMAYPLKNSGDNEIQYESGSEIILHCLHFGESCTNIAKRLFRFQEKPFFRQDLHFFKGCIPPSAASAAEYQYLFIPSELIP